jgi:hypothetical protein
MWYGRTEWGWVPPFSKWEAGFLLFLFNLAKKVKRFPQCEFFFS